LDWLNQHGAGSFGNWDSPQAFTDELIALSHLSDLARSEQVWELATVMMDKYFLSLALNSFRGVFGSSHGNARTNEIKSGLLEPTAGITRLMWGLGIFNRFTAGTVSLACMNKYELPPILAEIAAEPVAELWNREHHLIKLANAETPQDVNKVTYRTPDFMLSSAQDFHPGQSGAAQHIWQATLSPEAVIFVNHPVSSNEVDNGLPGYWLGNAALPQLANGKIYWFLFTNCHKTIGWALPTPGSQPTPLTNMSSKMVGLLRTKVMLTWR
jgi:hypothetical protein